MRIQSTSAAGEKVRESSITDCLKGLDKIICSIFDAHGKDGFNSKINEIFLSIQTTIGSFTSRKVIKILNLLMMIDDETKRRGMWKQFSI